MGASLRLATPGDAAEIAAVFRASRALLTFLPELHTAAEDRAYVRHELLVSQRVTVAMVAGRIAGFSAEREGWINQFYVAPDALRGGVGSLLMADAQHRNHTLTLWCFADNLRARAFYEKHGFVPLEATDGSGNEAHMPDVRYGWYR